MRCTARSILGTLLLITYINDLCQVSDILKPVMFPHDTKLKNLFLNTNLELKKISEWFQTSTLKL